MRYFAIFFQGDRCLIQKMGLLVDNDSKLLIFWGNRDGDFWNHGMRREIVLAFWGIEVR